MPNYSFATINRGHRILQKLMEASFIFRVNLDLGEAENIIQLLGDDPGDIVKDMWFNDTLLNKVAGGTEIWIRWQLGIARAIYNTGIFLRDDGIITKRYRILDGERRFKEYDPTESEEKEIPIARRRPLPTDETEEDEGYDEPYQKFDTTEEEPL